MSARVVATWLTLAIAGCAANEEAHPSPLAPERFFAPGSFWNQRLSPDAALDPRSGQLVAELRRQASAYGSTINTTRYSSPIYEVAADQPARRVQLDRDNSPLLQRAMDAVPIPDDARPAAGSDGNLVVWQPATDTMWEFWRLTREADGWHADWGGRMRDVSSSPGHYRDLADASGRYYERRHWGATATSLPRAGGLMRLEEIEAGTIRHALAFSIPAARRELWSWPAQRTDGLLDDPGAIPEGARFRLDPNLDVSALALPRMTRIMALAVQRYGMVLHNQAGAVAFYAEDPSPTGTNPYDALFSERRPAELMREFPWEHLQLLPLKLEGRRG